MRPGVRCQKTIYSIARPGFEGLPSGKHTKTMENQQFLWVNPLEVAIFNSWLLITYRNWLVVFRPTPLKNGVSSSVGIL